MESSNGGVEKDFHIILTKGDHIFKIDIPVEIPFPETRILEFTQRILTVFDLPIIFEDGKHSVSMVKCIISKLLVNQIIPSSMRFTQKWRTN